MNKCHQQRVNLSWMWKLVNRGRLGFALLKACTLSTVAEDRTSENQTLFSPLFYLYWQHSSKKEAFSKKTGLENLCLVGMHSIVITLGNQRLGWRQMETPVVFNSSCVSWHPRTMSTLPKLGFSGVPGLSRDSKLRANIRE